jgi:hypothetical protein
MKKIKNLFFIINILSIVKPALTVYAQDSIEISAREQAELKFRELLKQVELETVAFQLHPYRYLQLAKMNMDNLHSCFAYGKSDPTDQINSLIEALSGYVRMLSQKAETEAALEVISLLTGQISNLEEQRQLIAREKEGTNSSSIYKISKTLLRTVNQAISKYIIQDIVQKANQLLEKAFNDIEGEPLTYDQIQERLSALYNSGEDGMPLAIGPSEIVAFLQQIMKSQEAGLIHISKLIDPKNPERFSQFVIARSSTPSAEKFILPFSF